MTELPGGLSQHLELILLATEFPELEKVKEGGRGIGEGRESKKRRGRRGNGRYLYNESFL